MIYCDCHKGRVASIESWCQGGLCGAWTFNIKLNWIVAGIKYQRSSDYSTLNTYGSSFHPRWPVNRSWYHDVDTLHAKFILISYSLLQFSQPVVRQDKEKIILCLFSFLYEWYTCQLSNFFFLLQVWAGPKEVKAVEKTIPRIHHVYQPGTLHPLTDTHPLTDALNSSILSCASGASLKSSFKPSTVRNVWSSQWNPGVTTSVIKHPVLPFASSVPTLSAAWISSSGIRDIFQTLPSTSNMRVSPKETLVPITRFSMLGGLLDPGGLGRMSVYSARPWWRTW